MRPDNSTGNEQITADVTHTQLVHFTSCDPRCRGLELPEGLLLRYTLSRSLYFYLRTGIRDGKLWTRVYASDSAYDRQKTLIGDVLTPLFEPQTDIAHLSKVQTMILSWVDFVKEAPDDAVAFRNFPVDHSSGE
jgi:hypothetical protein